MNEAAYAREVVTPRQSLWPNWRERTFSLTLGVFLVATACIKVFAPAESAALQVAYELPRWLVVVAVQAELLVGFLWLFGWRPRVAWVATLGLFTIFAAFSLYRALAGYESCGCFGPIKINPWWTFSLDVAILSLLTIRRSPLLIQQRSAPQGAKLFAGGATYFVLSILLAITMMGPGPTVLRGESPSLADGHLVILEPEEWIGQEFPLEGSISPAITLSNGEWVVLLYHHDCPKCQEALPQYERLAAQMASLGGTVRLLLIEVPPYGEVAGRDRANLAARARLSDEREWFAQTPVEIQLQDGRVKVASLDLPSIATVP